MVKNKKFIIAIVLIITTIITVAGINFEIDYNNRIIITQFAPKSNRQSMGYMLKTNKNKIIMIDGGTVNDTEHVKNEIKNNGGIVEYWYLTHAHDDHFGVLYNILNEENSEIEVKNICLKFNDEEWYIKNDSERYENNLIKDLFDVLEKEENKSKIHVLENKEEIKIDNLTFKILKTVSPHITENAGNNQSVVIKVSNKKKSALFLGDLGKQAEEEFIKDNIYDIDCDVVQMAHHGQDGVTFKTYELISPQICLWPTPDWLYDNNIGDGFNTAEYKTIETREWIKKLNVRNNYIAKDGDLKIEIY